VLSASIDPDALADERIAAAAALEMEARLGDIWHDVMLAEVASEERYACCGRCDCVLRVRRSTSYAAKAIARAHFSSA